MRLIFISLLVCWAFSAPAQTYTVKTVPNTKLVNNSYVSNPDQILAETTAAEINSLLSSLEQQTTAQVAVVAINDIGDADVFDFAQELFNEWGIGQAKEDNGLLILLVLEKRTVRLHTGYGLEGDLPDIICKHIETQKMVPYFKEGNYDQGVLAGVQEVVRILGNVTYADSLRTELTKPTEDYDVDYTSNDYDSGPLDIRGFLQWTAAIWTVIMVILYFYNKKKGEFTDSATYKATGKPNIKSNGFHFLFWFLILPVGLMIGMYFVNRVWVFIGSFYAYLGLGGIETQLRMNSAFHEGVKKKDYYGTHQLLFEKLSLWKMMAVLFPIPFAFLYKPFKKRMTFLREHPRECGQCGHMATRHSETTEDPFLNDKQKFEEKLETVDYDVWQCPDCKAHQVFRYPSPQTKYEDCPKCSTVAYYVSSTRTLRSATEDHEGLKEETKTCKFCKFQNVRTYTTPKLSKSSSGSGGGSSGGSWGGGSSGGGGASSSW